MTQRNIRSPLMTVADVAAEVTVHPKTVIRWIAKRDLPAARLGRSFRVKREDLDAFLAARSTERAS